MASLRRLIPFKIFSKVRIQSIMTTPKNLENALDALQKNPYYGKYADRIAELQKTSPEELMRRVEQQQQAREEEKKKKFAPVDTRQFSSALNPKGSAPEGSTPSEERLDDVLRLELVSDKTGAEIQAIWEEYHRQRDAICAAIPAALYSAMRDNMRNHPTFLLPLPRDHGYEFVVCQSAQNAVHFTPLLAYQVHKENAPECLKIVHYTDLAERTGLVLMRGLYDKAVLSGREARCLADQFQLYYNGRDESRLALLHTFTTKPAEFRHADLLRQLETLELPASPPQQ